MGSLEDAIREHLELKRRRGADPAEVAREQHDALDPPTGENAVAWADGPAAMDGDEAASAPETAAPDDGDSSPPDGSATGAGDPLAGGPATLASAGQETAELDMRTVLLEGPAGDGERVRPVGPIVAAPARAQARPLVEEESLEWEMPNDSPGREAERPEHVVQPPEQERMSFE